MSSYNRIKLSKIIFILYIYIFTILGFSEFYLIFIRPFVLSSGGFWNIRSWNGKNTVKLATWHDWPNLVIVVFKKINNLGIEHKRVVHWSLFCSHLQDLPISCFAVQKNKQKKETKMGVNRLLRSNLRTQVTFTCKTNLVYLGISSASCVFSVISSVFHVKKFGYFVLWTIHAVHHSQASAKQSFCLLISLSWHPRLC